MRARTAARAAFVAGVALLVVWVAWAAAVFDTLPARIPTHFGGDGRPDAWSDRSLTQWMLLPAIGGATFAFLALTRGLVRRWPRLVNVPEKQRFLRLPRDRQLEVVRELDGILAATGISTLLLFATLHVQSWRVATGRDDGLSALSLVVLVLCILVPAVVALTGTRRMEARIRALETAGQPR